MTEPCNKGPDIDKLKVEQIRQGEKLDRVLINQETQAKDLKQAIDRLASIIEADISTRKDVEQLKKDRETLFSKVHLTDGRVSAIEVRNAKCDGAGIFEKFPRVWDWYQGELGWRRFIPATMAVLSFLFAMFTFLANHTTIEEFPYSHVPDPRGGVVSDYGVDK